MKNFVPHWGLAGISVIVCSAAFADVPDSDVASGSIDPQRRMSVYITLKSGYEHRLDRMIRESSDPDNAKYGNFPTLSDLKENFGPSQTALQVVHRFLSSRKIAATTDALGIGVKAEMTAGQLESIFNTKATSRIDPQSHQFVTTTEKPIQVPSRIRGYVESISLFNVTLPPKAFKPRKTKAYAAKAESPTALVASTLGVLPPSAFSNTGSPSGCAIDAFGGAYTPNQWLSAYGLDTLQQGGLKGQGQRIALLETDGFSIPALQFYNNCFSLGPLPPINTYVVKGGLTPTAQIGSEAMLDLQVLLPAVPSIGGIDVYFSVDNLGNPVSTPDSFADALQMALTQPKSRRPDVISISDYSSCEAWGTQAATARLEKTFKRAAALGIPIFVATGDTGAASCRIDTESFNQTPFTAVDPVTSVQYPSSSPWVTAVGGTNIRLNAKNQILEEVTWNDWQLFPAGYEIDGAPVYSINIGAGTGGVSQWFKQPKWQKVPELVGYYINPTYGTAETASTGRRVPDMAMLADGQPGYAVVGSLVSASEGTFTIDGGTSAAAPLAAASMALVRQGLERAHRKPVGFFNPTLYKIGNTPGLSQSVLNDVRVGNNYVTWQVSPLVIDTSLNLVLQLQGYFASSTYMPGYQATTGYDTATGWGSLNAAGLLETLINMKR